MYTKLFFLKAVSDVITAGVAVISFSLFVYAVTFKLRDYVTRSFVCILACIVIVFGADAFVTTTIDPSELLFILRIQYIGLIFLPTTYFHFSDALLAMTGKPSKGKRKISGYISILISLTFLFFLINGQLISSVVTSNPPAPHIARTIYHDIFTIFFIFTLLMAWYNFIRSVIRTSTATSRRRMVYLVVSAIGPAAASFPYLLYGSGFAAQNSILFWVLSIFANIFVIFSLVGMTYTVSFFGFPWPDRVIKSRLFRWIMRGPVTASITLGVTTMINRIGQQFGFDISAFIILGMIASIVLFEFSINIFAPVWERLLFNPSDRKDLKKIRLLEDRLLTKNDLSQFIELLLATMCDRLQISGAVLIENRVGASALRVAVGKSKKGLFSEKENIAELFSGKEEIPEYVIFKNKTIIPIVGSSSENEILGFIGTKHFEIEKLDDDRKAALNKIVTRASLALQDRKMQDDVIESLELLTPQVTAFQNLLATSRFNQRRIMNGEISGSEEFEKWVKDALNHFFGGPRLSQNPLLQLSSVAKRMHENDKSSINALRAIIREAIKKLRPNGDRQFTNEWILFNILDYKFIEGWKVKDISRRLALSEADFYRKQRIAISAVADQLLKIENSTE